MNSLPSFNAVNTKRLTLLVFTFFTSLSLFAQYNLVPNPSFENYIVCPNDPLDPPPPPWYTPTTYVCPYANSCSTSPNSGVPYNALGNYQYPHSGNGYIGLDYINQYKQNHRNYIQVQLKDSLQKGKCYYVEYFVVGQDNAGSHCNNVSALLTKSPKYVDTLNYPNGIMFSNAQIYNYGNPIIKDTQNWVKISAIYISQGGEKYLTLGNFAYDILTNYIRFDSSMYDGAGYYIDDVLITPLDSFSFKAEAGSDATITKGDSLYIGSYTNGIANIKWYDAGGNVIDNFRPGFWVKPTSNTFYIVEQDVCGQYSRDTVFVNVKALPVTILSFNVSAFKSFNGNTNTLVNWETATEINVDHFNIQRSENGIKFYTINTVNAEGASRYTYNDVPNLIGVIYYRLENVDKNGAISYSEVKQLIIDNGELIISPNPSNDYVTISGGNIKEVRISDVSGRVVKISKERRIDISGLKSGLYFISIESLNGAVEMKKFVKL